MTCETSLNLELFRIGSHDHYRTKGEALVHGGKQSLAVMLEDTVFPDSSASKVRCILLNVAKDN